MVCNVSVVVAVGKDLKKGDLVGEVSKKRVDLELFAVGVPDDPVLVLGFGRFRLNAFDNRKKISAEFMEELR